MPLQSRSLLDMILDDMDMAMMIIMVITFFSVIFWVFLTQGSCHIFQNSCSKNHFLTKFKVEAQISKDWESPIPNSKIFSLITVRNPDSRRLNKGSFDPAVTLYCREIQYCKLYLCHLICRIGLYKHLTYGLPRVTSHPTTFILT